MPPRPPSAPTPREPSAPACSSPPARSPSIRQPARSWTATWWCRRERVFANLDAVLQRGGHRLGPRAQGDGVPAGHGATSRASTRSTPRPWAAPVRRAPPCRCRRCRAACSIEIDVIALAGEALSRAMADLHTRRPARSSSASPRSRAAPAERPRWVRGTCHASWRRSPSERMTGCSSDARRSTTPGSSGCATISRSCRRSTSSPPCSTTRTTSAAWPPPTRCPTSTPWVASR